jgi:hypothetical protein
MPRRSPSLRQGPLAERLQSQLRHLFEALSAKVTSRDPITDRRPRNTPTATRQWHDLKVRISGTKVEDYLDGKLYLEHSLPESVSGRIGLWSKADSYVYFTDYSATPAN